MVDAWSPAVRRRAVEVEFAAAPQLVVGVNGKIAESEEEETLLLKSVQSVEERYPLLAAEDWVIESVLAENKSGPETIAEVTCPVPFPVKSPPKVVEPVPPKLVAIVVEPITEPFALVVRMEEAMLVMARFVVVACWREVFPETVSVEASVAAPLTLRRALIVVEAER